VVREFSRMGRTAPPVKILRCADNEPPNLTQPPRDQAGIRQSGDPQSHIEAAADEIDYFVAKTKIDRHLRIGTQEFR
jgi:hypothetical protein